MELGRSETAGNYLLRLRQAGGSASNQYRLNLTVGEAGACIDDDFEPNAEIESASLCPTAFTTFDCVQAMSIGSGLLFRGEYRQLATDRWGSTFAHDALR